MTGVASRPGREVHLWGQTYGVVPPKPTDPRLHLAAVIGTIHVLGQVSLDFDISIAQILLAIGCAGIVEFLIVAVRHRDLAWPASGLLAGSGVALILRVPGTEHGDWWSLRGWYYFVGIAAAAVLSKSIFRWRGQHIFNPSNIALVLAFLFFGSSRIEPLDFWWGPLSVGLIVAYLVIIVGGELITRRLGLFEMAGAFWLTFVAALAVVAATGHCMTAKWSFTPVCGSRFWWILATSPEVLIFLFFMITDPRTSPRGRVGRILFGSAVGLTAATLIATQSTEFGAKVGLLASLALICVVRTVLRSRVTLPGTARPDRFLARQALARPALLVLSPIVALVVLVGASAVADEPPDPPAGSPSGEVYAGPLPPIEISSEVRDIEPDFDETDAADLGRDLLTSLGRQSEALVDGDPALAQAASHGLRLEQLLGAIARADRGGRVVVTSWDIDHLTVVVTSPGGPQAGPVLSLDAVGTRHDRTFAGSPLREQSTLVTETEVVFAMREAEDGHYLVVDELPPAGG